MQRATTFYVTVRPQSKTRGWEGTFLSTQCPNAGIIEEAIRDSYDRLSVAVEREQELATDPECTTKTTKWLEEGEDKLHAWESCVAVVQTHRANIKLGMSPVFVADTKVGYIQVIEQEVFVALTTRPVPLTSTE